MLLQHCRKKCPFRLKKPPNPTNVIFYFCTIQIDHLRESQLKNAKYPKPSENVLPKNIFRTITVVILLSCRNTPNQKVNFSSICRSVLVFTGKAPVFCLAAVHILPWQDFLGQLTVNIALAHSSTPILTVPATRFLITHGELQNPCTRGA